MENSNQDNINSFLDSMDDFDSAPAAEAPSPQSVPFTPAAVWPGEEQAQQTAAERTLFFLCAFLISL